jgi:hypothetical protein
MHAHALMQAIIKRQACAVSNNFSALQQYLLCSAHVPSCLICPATAVAVPLLQVADHKNMLPTSHPGMSTCLVLALMILAACCKKMVVFMDAFIAKGPMTAASAYLKGVTTRRHDVMFTSGAWGTYDENDTWIDA